MNDAELYHRANELQRRDAEEVMRQHGNRLRWRGEDRLLDVGCGDGDVLASVVLPRLPGALAGATGVDLSADMVRYAGALYAGPALDFRVMDISVRVGPEQHERYDHVLSFYCLHWVQNQRTALENIYNVLKHGGDCLLSFGAKNRIYDVYKLLASSPKWLEYMGDVDDYISPYHSCADPAAAFRELLVAVGFQDVHVECSAKTYYYDGFKNLRKSVFAVSPFLARIPAELHDEYFDDYVVAVRSFGLVEEDNNNVGEGVRIRTPYHSVVAYAAK